MLVTNGDIVRNMTNKDLAEIFCTLISHKINKDLEFKLDKSSKEWYNENVVNGIKEWLDEPYYDINCNVIEKESKE